MTVVGCMPYGAVQDPPPLERLIERRQAFARAIFHAHDLNGTSRDRSVFELCGS